MTSRKKKPARASRAFVTREVAAVTNFPPGDMAFDREGEIAWVEVGGDSCTVYRDLATAKRSCVGDVVGNLVHDWGCGSLEVDTFTWREVYAALSVVVDWVELRPWVVARARERGLGEASLLANVPRAVPELCRQGGEVDYEEASLALQLQGRVKLRKFAGALVDSCGGPAGFVAHVDGRALVRTPGGLVVEVDGACALPGAPRVGSKKVKKFPLTN